MSVTPQPLSLYFGISPKDFDKFKAFNAYLGIDNRLFVDPRLLSQVKIGEFVGSRAEITDYFSKVIKLLSKSKKLNDIAYLAARSRLIFAEENGAALGYSNAGGSGRGITGKLASVLAARAKEIVDLGIDDPEVFELIGLFQEGFGPDLLSDMAIAILRRRFFAYTQRITNALNLKPRDIYTWGGQDWTLPSRPDADGPLIIVPKDLLNDLPVALDRSEIAQAASFSAELRTVWNAIVAEARQKNRRVTKKDIRKVLLEKPQNLLNLIEFYRSAAASGYDFANDPDGLFSWDVIGRQAAADSPLTIANHKPKSLSDVLGIVRSIIAQFTKNIEENKLYEVLYGESGKPRDEVFSQRLFYAVADAYCSANDVDLSREPNAGNGPVDFKVSSGYKGRVLVELKKSNSSKLVHGFETQLKSYAKAEATSWLIYLIVRISDSEVLIKKVLQLRATALSKGERVPEVFVIDARRKPSASKRKK